jgi:signal peptidase I
MQQAESNGNRPLASLRKAIRNFLLPSWKPGYLVRILVVGVAAYLFFGKLCLPMRIDGKSMEPTYSDGAFLFCRRPVFRSGRDFKRGDVVVIRLAGTRVMMLKRIVALEGDTVAFANGRLHVNGQALDEPYVRYSCDWELAPRTVEPGNVYVVGDNRGVPIDAHHFGQTPSARIVGVPLW